jgi:phosphoribosyl 1,2-cyclic phosphodiesterase
MSIRPKFAGEQAAGMEPVRLKFWGVRGSIPTPGPQTVRFGGNTSCVEVRADGQIVILDAGTGLRPLGIALGAEFRDRPQQLTLLITHTHSDHIQGFPFFGPAYQPQNQIRVLGYEATRRGLQEVLAMQMETPFFPVPLSQMPGNIVFEDLKDTAFQIGPIRVSSCRTNHPGTCYGYRLDTSCGSICYIPDHETVASPADSKSAPVTEMIRDADLVILDSQYTVEEYREHKGWGHGCMDDVIQVARDARVKRLYLFHHDPSHDDEFLDKMLQRARRLAMGSGMRVESAREGEQVMLAAKTQV